MRNLSIKAKFILLSVGVVAILAVMVGIGAYETRRIVEEQINTVGLETEKPGRTGSTAISTSWRPSWKTSGSRPGS